MQWRPNISSFGGDIELHSTAELEAWVEPQQNVSIKGFWWTNFDIQHIAGKLLQGTNYFCTQTILNA